MNWSDAIVGGAVGAAVWWMVTHVLESAESDAEAERDDTRGPIEWTPVWERTARGEWHFISWQPSPSAARDMARMLDELGVFDRGRSRFIVGTA